MMGAAMKYGSCAVPGESIAFQSSASSARLTVRRTRRRRRSPTTVASQCASFMSSSRSGTRADRWMEFRRVSEEVGFQMPLTDYQRGWVASTANAGPRAVSVTLN